MSIDSKAEKKLLHYTGKAIADFNMIQTGDKVLVCLSGGKDSFVLLKILHLLQMRTNNKFSLFSLTVDQGIPGWDDSLVREWLKKEKVPFEIICKDTFAIVKEKVKPGESYCPLCSRLRRGIIYRYAREHGFNKIALGHHRDDLIATLLISIFYTGSIRAMPPKLLTDDKQLIVVRPLAYCQEKDIIQYAQENEFPLIDKNICASKENKKRNSMTKLITELAKDNKKVPSNLLHALQNLQPSQLMDHKLWNFKQLEEEQIK